MTAGTCTSTKPGLNQSSFNYFLLEFVFTTFEEELLVGRPPENKERQANDISADDKFLHEGSKQKSVK